MNNTHSSKPLIVCIIILVLAILGWWYFKTPQSSTAQPVPVAQVSSTTPAQNTSDISNPADTSDAALNQDMTNIDAQMTGLNTDVSNANTPTQ
jgi:predicted negative regulator of RcsB-dependent stress response